LNNMAALLHPGERTKRVADVRCESKGEMLKASSRLSWAGFSPSATVYGEPLFLPLTEEHPL
jgi:hypothetical protein